MTTSQKGKETNNQKTKKKKSEREQCGGSGEAKKKTTEKEYRKCIHTQTNNRGAFPQKAARISYSIYAVHIPT